MPLFSRSAAHPRHKQQTTLVCPGRGENRGRTEVTGPAEVGVRSLTAAGGAPVCGRVRSPGQPQVISCLLHTSATQPPCRVMPGVVPQRGVSGCETAAKTTTAATAAAAAAVQAVQEVQEVLRYRRVAICRVPLAQNRLRAALDEIINQVRRGPISGAAGGLSGRSGSN